MKDKIFKMLKTNYKKLALVLIIMAVLSAGYVYWNNKYNAPNGDFIITESYAKSGVVSRGDVWLLARLINGEARGEPYVGKVAVAAVVLNRVVNPAFPKSVPAVIYEPGAFESVSNGQIWTTLNADSVKAAEDAMAGWDPTGGALFFWNPVTAKSRWVWSRPIITQIGKHVFAK